LVEINTSTKYLFNIKGSKFQNIQFLPDFKKNLYYILFLRDQEKIEMYSIGIEEKNGISKIYQPELHGTFIKQHIWSSWNPETSILSYISKKSSGFILSACSFKDVYKPSILYEQELYLNIPTEISYDKYPWRNGHKSPNNSINFSLLQFQNNILLCQQLMNESNEKIEIVIFALHLKLKFSISIPIQHDGSLNVLFGHLYNLLMIYIPGYYLKFVDCNQKNILDVFTWISNEKKIYVPFLPNEHKSVQTLLLPQSEEKSLIFDLHKGIIYQFDLNDENFIDWFENEESTMSLTRSFYFVINYLKDEDLLEMVRTQIIHSRC
jgi:hypothetical protein